MCIQCVHVKLLNKTSVDLVTQIADNAAGAAVVQRLRGVDTVQYVENDLCVKVAQGRDAFSRNSVVATRE